MLAASTRAAIQRTKIPREITVSPLLRLAWLPVEAFAKIRSDLPRRDHGCANHENATLWRGKNTTSRRAIHRPPASFHPRLPAPLTINSSSRTTNLGHFRPFRPLDPGGANARARGRSPVTFPTSIAKHSYLLERFRQKPCLAAQESLTGILSACAGYCNNRRPVNVQSE